MNRMSKIAAWIVLGCTLTVISWKGREAYREYRALTDAADLLVDACKDSGPPCLKSAGADY